MADRYEPASFEAKWRQRWLEADLFRTKEKPDARKFYGLDFFPYPSGAGLSVGHCKNFVPTDVICRMKAMQGFNVLHPMGFDAFGLPAENEAIKRHTHPAPMIERYAQRYKDQMELIGISYDWSRAFKSSDPDYYKWTQWIFELLYKRGLAYRKSASVNWDPVEKTVLADEEVIAGRGERSGALVEKKWIPQWFFKITDYAQRLLDDLDTIDWPEGIKTQQRNWIGRSEGVQFSMKVVFHTPQQAAQPESEAKKDDPLAELEAEIRASGFQPEGDMSKINKAKEISDKLNKHAEDAHKFDLDQIDGIMQKMRGLEEGLEVSPHGKELSFDVFTTRVDTIFGMTFCVLAPEHPIVEKILPNVLPDHRAEVDKYREQARTLSEADRQVVNREKTGVFTGAYAVNPANGKHVPIWIADYVLATYGTGAIMAVPGHDQRDFDFAVKFGLDVVPVIKPSADYLKAHAQGDFNEEREYARYLADVKSFTDPFDSKDATLINSGEYDGLTVSEAQKGLGLWIEGLGIGDRKVQYKLRDWLISRQRYWGCPIPIIHTRDGEDQLAPLDSLPVELPWVENYEPSGDGASPLARITEFVNTTDLDGRLGQRETDTMGGFACSSWYFLRFCDPHNEERAWDPGKVSYWMPVDCYVGGAEHAVMHLLYARFWTKVLYDAELVTVKEPFQRLLNQGQVLARTPFRKPREGEHLALGEEGILVPFEEAKLLPEDQVFYRWARMSKSKGNVVTPEEAVEQAGADALRLYLLFRAPFDADIEWENKGMEDLGRFLSRVFRIIDATKRDYVQEWRDLIDFESLDDSSRKLRRVTHQTIRNVTGDIEKLSLNTYVSWLMKYVNELNPVVLPTRGAQEEKTPRSRAEVLALSEAVDTLILLLAPGAPHSADELWEATGHDGFTFEAEWPRFNEQLAVEDLVTVAVQVNGKLRDTFEISPDADVPTQEEAAKACLKVAPHLDGKTIRRMIVVPGKLVNIVAN
ncbi:MAG TPA: leucine--tRNA ligase [Fimbriimonas sp.]|nr:leucine--tRNA ligase [Fimbriimonas sp.]